jgi:hypothetical protein
VYQPGRATWRSRPVSRLQVDSGGKTRNLHFGRTESKKKKILQGVKQISLTLQGGKDLLTLLLIKYSYTLISLIKKHLYKTIWIKKEIGKCAFVCPSNNRGFSVPFVHQLFVFHKITNKLNNLD